MTGSDPRGDGCWPDIDGISPDIIRDQIDGDARLFLALLRRLVDDFADVRAMVATMDGATIATFGNRMHKLKGAAATLGAIAIADHAARAEAASEMGDLAECARLAAAIGSALDALRDSIAEAEAQPATGLARDEIPPSSLDHHGQADLRELARLLRQQSRAGLRLYDTAEPALRQLLGGEAARILRAHIDNLRFADAAKVVEGLARTTR